MYSCAGTITLTSPCPFSTRFFPPSSIPSHFSHFLFLLIFRTQKKDEIGGGLLFPLWMPLPLKGRVCKADGGKEDDGGFSVDEGMAKER